MFYVFNKTVSGNNFVNVLYHKIPALIRSVQIVTIAVLLSMLLRFIMHKGFAHSNRAITIVKLLESFVRWLIAIVVINDWRGTVQEIGIRTTKIVDSGGNINIVNNSEITTVINQTQEISQASVTVGIEYGESLPRVEIVIRDNLDMIKEHIPAIIDGPFYKGVTALNSSSVDLLFVAKCREEDIFQVQRDMNRELKLLFDANDIGIPFPQIVVNEPATFNTKTTKRMETGARDFIEEQKEQSKGLEEENH